MLAFFIPEILTRWSPHSPNQNPPPRGSSLWPTTILTWIPPFPHCGSLWPWCVRVQMWAMAGPTLALLPRSWSAGREAWTSYDLLSKSKQIKPTCVLQVMFRTTQRCLEADLHFSSRNSCTIILDTQWGQGHLLSCLRMPPIHGVFVFPDFHLARSNGKCVCLCVCVCAGVRVKMGAIWCVQMKVTWSCFHFQKDPFDSTCILPCVLRHVLSSALGSFVGLFGTCFGSHLCRPGTVSLLMFTWLLSPNGWVCDSGVSYKRF